MKPSAAERLYEAILHLYPPAFFRQFAGDMLMDFCDSYRMLQACDSQHRASYLVHAFIDLTVSVLTQWSRTDCIRIAMRMAVGNMGLWALATWIACREWPNGPMTATSLMQFAVFVAVMTVVTVTAIALGSGRHTAPVSLHAGGVLPMPRCATPERY